MRVFQATAASRRRPSSATPRPRHAHVALCAPVQSAVERLEDRTLFAVITVTGVGDAVAVDGQVTLREAITAANTNAPAGDAPAGDPGFDTIRFKIPGAGVHTIAPATRLPNVVEPVLIDGYSQPGSSPNTLAVGNDAVLNVQLSGGGKGLVDYGLVLNTSKSTVRGLVINGFGSAVGIGPGSGVFTATDNVVAGNFVGTDPSGFAAVPNLGHAIAISSGRNRVGGTAPADRNLISGNGSGIHGGIFINSPGVTAGAADNVIQGNYIGTDRTGGKAIGNSYGIYLYEGSDRTVIGGTAKGAGNLISGNHGFEVIAAFGDKLVIQQNRVGTNATGTAAIGGLGPAANGIFFYDSVDGSLVGGDSAAARNVISGHSTGGGLFVSGVGNRIRGNYVGTNAAGTGAIPNAVGVLVGGGGNRVGGTLAGQRNVISGNGDRGAILDHTTGTNTVVGNYIGTTASGLAPLGNGSHGVYLGASAAGNEVGLAVAGGGNLIAANGGSGVVIDGPGAKYNRVLNNRIGAAGLGNAGHGVLIAGGANNNYVSGGNTITRNGGDGVAVTGAGSLDNVIALNSIDDNGGLGIDLGDDGVTLNDALDPDAGPNALQNAPVLLSAVLSGGTLTVKGRLNSTPGGKFAVDFYASPAADPSGFGEGRRYLGTAGSTAAPLVTDAAGNVLFAKVLPAVPAGWVVTATTQTVPVGGTSEFSRALKVVAAPGTIAGTAFKDVDADGVRDPGEGGLSGWRIYLDANDNRRYDVGEQTTLTDALGRYTFGGLTPGTYRVREVVPPAWRQTAPFGGVHLIAIGPGSLAVNKDFGDVLRPVVGG